MSNRRMFLNGIFNICTIWIKSISLYRNLLVSVCQPQTFTDQKSLFGFSLLWKWNKLLEMPCNSREILWLPLYSSILISKLLLSCLLLCSSELCFRTSWRLSLTSLLWPFICETQWRLVRPGSYRVKIGLRLNFLGRSVSRGVNSGCRYCRSLRIPGSL
jgi:hypothetical protein